MFLIQNDNKEEVARRESLTAFLASLPKLPGGGPFFVTDEEGEFRAKLLKDGKEGWRIDWSPRGAS